MKILRHRKTTTIGRGYIEKIARKAIQCGFIEILELRNIMAVERFYAGVLVKLRKEFFPPIHILSDDLWVKFDGGCDRDTKAGDTCRFCYWANLLRRWTGLIPNEAERATKPIPYIPCYLFNKVNGRYERIDLKTSTFDFLSGSFLECSIKLEDFKEYVKDIEETYQLRMPLPKTLYPDEAYDDISEPVEDQDLPPKEARELGQLRRQKENWDNSIKAAVIATLFCEHQDHRVTRDELRRELFSQQDLPSIPETSFRRVWKAIPQKFKHIGGSPQKSS